MVTPEDQRDLIAARSQPAKRLPDQQQAMKRMDRAIELIAKAGARHFAENAALRAQFEALKEEDDDDDE